MKQKLKSALWIVTLCVVTALIVWHAIDWHAGRVYLEMFHWLHTGKAYVTVLYNLGLMLVLGSALGLVVGKITDLLQYKGDANKYNKPE